MKYFKLLLSFSFLALSLLNCTKSEENPSVNEPPSDNEEVDDSTIVNSIGTPLFTAEILDQSFSEGNFSIWLMIHDGKGNLVHISKAKMGTEELLSEESFLGKDIYVTIGFLVNSGEYQRIAFQTYQAKIGGKWIYKPAFIPEFLERNLTGEVQITLSPEVRPDSYGNPYVARGDTYSLYPNTLPTENMQTSELRYSEETTKAIIQISQHKSFNGKKEGYYYYAFNPQEVVFPLILDDSNFTRLESSVKLNIPNDGLENLRFVRHGYENKFDFDNYRRHYIYNLDRIPYQDYVDFPIIPGLEIYENFVSYRKGDFNYNFRSSGNSINIDLPNWTLSYTKKDDGYELNSENDGDTFFIDFHKSGIINGINKTYFWQYYWDASSAISFIPRLSLPEEILTEFNGEFYTKNDVPDFRWLSISDNDENVDYEDFLKKSFGIKPRMNDRDLGYGRSMTLSF